MSVRLREDYLPATTTGNRVSRRVAGKGAGEPFERNRGRRLRGHPVHTTAAGRLLLMFLSPLQHDPAVEAEADRPAAWTVDNGVGATSTSGLESAGANVFFS